MQTLYANETNNAAFFRGLLVWRQTSPNANLTACFTEANFISVYMGLYPVPRPSFFSQLAGKEK
jgi:hypothetical protein